MARMPLVLMIFKPSFISPLMPLTGQRRLVKATEQYDGALSVELEWKPHIIDPTVSLQGELFETYCKKRWGSTAVHARVFTEGAKEGLKLAGWKWWANSARAHQWVQYGLRAGIPSLMTTSVLFEAHFEHGENLSLVDTLVRLAATHFPSWNQDDLRVFLESNLGQEDLQKALHRGKVEDRCSSVPFFVVHAPNGVNLPMTGSHPTEDFVQIFQELEADVTREEDADIRMEMNH